MADDFDLDAVVNGWSDEPDEPAADHAGGMGAITVGDLGDMDAALREYDEATQAGDQTEAQAEAQTGAPPDNPSDPDSLQATLEQMHGTQQQIVEHIRQEQVAKDIRAAVAVAQDVVGDLADEKTVETFLHGQHAVDPKFRSAWENRYERPEAWRGALKKVAYSLREQLENRPDPNLTADREAVAAAVRGISTRPAGDDDTMPDFSGMNDAQFETWVKKTYGYRPSVR